MGAAHDGLIDETTSSTRPDSIGDGGKRANQRIAIMNHTLRALSLAAFSVMALQAHAATTGDDSFYPGSMRAGTGTGSGSVASAAATGAMAMPSSATRSSYVWRGNEAGLTLETGPAAAAGDRMKDSQAMPQPAGAARRESVFLGA